MIGRSAWTADVAMGRLPYPDVVAVAERDGSILVVPVGSTEQHGHHLPVTTDTLLAEAVAVGGAEEAADDVPVLVAPPVATGHSPHHEAFGGTLSVDGRTLADLLVELSRSAGRGGFDAVLVVNGHAGNEPFVAAATRTAGPAAEGATLYGLTYFGLAADVIDDRRNSPVGGMGHGGEFETALALHLFPELVRTGEATGGERDPPTDYESRDLFDDGPLHAYRPFADRTDTGILGEPGAASAEAGEALFGYLREELGRLLVQVHGDAGA
jgi:creatinine amidohydrolase